MYGSQRLIWVAGWLIVVCIASTSPGCGCTKTEPDRATAEASTPAEEASELVKLAPSPEKSEQSEPDEKEAQSSSLPPPSNPSEQNPTTDETEAAPASADARKKGGNAVGSSKHPKESKVPTGDPRDAKRVAKELSAAAKKSATKGNYPQAFREARQGWEAVSPFSQDAECRALTQTLLQQMRQLSAKANAGVKSDSTKTLVVE
jgi:hypothetical protein